MTAPLTFHIIPHTHWDREWYLPRATFQARLVGVVDAVLELLDGEPDARFVCDGQTILASDAATIDGAIRPRIAAAADRGQLDVGPWYVLADELIPSGESLVRNLLEGRRDTAAHCARMDVCYSPDAFGHPAMLPAIARQFGIDVGVVWRGLAPDERGDVDLRLWRAPDGSEMLLYHLPAAGYEIGSGLLGHDAVAQWGRIRETLVGRAATSHIAVFVGADHHAPPPSLCSIRDHIATAETGHHVRLSTLTEFFAAVRAQRGSLTAVEGELRWSYGHTWTLQGVHATRARMKRDHSLVELQMLRRAEPLSAIAALVQPASRRHRALLLTHARRIMLEAQFHDTIAGTTIDAVAREQGVRLAAARAVHDEVAGLALHAVLGHAADRARDGTAHAVPTLCLWNPVPRARNGITVCDVTLFRRDVLVGPPDGRRARQSGPPQPFALLATDGMRIPVQVIAREVVAERIDAARHYPDQDEVERLTIAFEAPPTPGFGFRALTPVHSHEEPGDRGLHVTAHRMANSFVTVTVTDTGRISLTDHRTQQVYPGLLELDDECDCGDTYSPHIRPDVATASAAIPLSHSFMAGPLVGTIDIGWSMRSAGAGEIICHLQLTLHADSPVLRVRYAVDNAATNHRLRARLPVGAGEAAIAGAAFAAPTRRPVSALEHDYPAEWPVPTAPAHRFVAAGAGARGLIVMHPGFFEYEWTAERDLLVTLIRSVGELSVGDLPTRPGHAGWPTPTPEAQEQGWHVIEMAIAPVDQGDLVRPDLVERVWSEAFLPLAGTFLRDFTGDVAVAEEVGVLLRGEGLVFSSMKPAEDGNGVVLRCYNVSDKPVTGEWETAFVLAGAWVVRLDETAVRPIAVDGGVIRFTAPPHGIVSIRITVVG